MNSERTLKNAHITTTVDTSGHGQPEPAIHVRAPEGTSHRALKAELYRLAAATELATSGGEGWIVIVDAYADGAGRVYLELLGATQAESERGLSMLRALAEQV